MLCILYFALLFHRQRAEEEVKDPVTVRKVQKADREKLRRDRLNEHFLELGNAIGNLYNFFCILLSSVFLHMVMSSQTPCLWTSVCLEKLIHFQ